MRARLTNSVFVLAALLVGGTVLASFPSTLVAAEPITLSIIDTGGDLSSTQPIIENYKKANPDKVKEIKIQRAPAPELPAKIKAQQDAGRLDINLILTGQDGGSVIAANKQVIKLFPDYDTLFPRDELTDAAKELQDEGEGYLIPSVTSPGGPVFIYNPSKIANPPKRADELLAWAKLNPGRFMYARPANSGPGRSILQGMPYILGDTGPMEPRSYRACRISSAIQARWSRRVGGKRPGPFSRSWDDMLNTIRPAPPLP
jgi:putative spermidine/putrescine transport system substrate-binding protein